MGEEKVSEKDIEAPVKDQFFTEVFTEYQRASHI